MVNILCAALTSGLTLSPGLDFILGGNNGFVYKVGFNFVHDILREGVVVSTELVLS